MLKHERPLGFFSLSALLIPNNIKMESKSEKAVQTFQSGFNCAQSVLTAFADDYNVDTEIALQISLGFGGGMGRLQKTCGAVTGAFMVLGLHNAKNYTDNHDKKAHTYSMIQDYQIEFIQRHGTIDCDKLLNCDLTTESGQQYAKDNNLFVTVCERCVFDSVEILERIVNK
jgi:C_GCAxxG_C_C family probable redox protein